MEHFILKHKKQPTKAELAIFYYNRYVESKKKDTLPFLTEQWIDDLLTAYEPSFQGQNIPHIIGVLKESQSK